VGAWVQDGHCVGDVVVGVCVGGVGFCVGGVGDAVVGFCVGDAVVGFCVGLWVGHPSLDSDPQLHTMLERERQKYLGQSSNRLHCLWL
jgi:hypothetical protein